MRVRVITGITEGQETRARQAAQNVVRAFCTSQAKSPQPMAVQVVLHLVGPAADLSDRKAINVEQARLREEFADSWIDLIGLRGEGADEKDVAHQLGEFGDRLLKTDADDLVVILVREGLGTDAMRRAFSSLADLFEVAVASGDEPGGASAAEPFKLEPLISGVSLPRVQRTTAVVLSGGLHAPGGRRRRVESPLLTESGEQHAMPSRALLSLSTSIARNSSTMVSTCALLLQGYPAGVALAERLRSMIQGWERERIWDASYVNEMVLHDESHSMSVDRNVAMLCSELLYNELLTVDDVYVLALCAWLHDWGHASHPVRGRFPTDPVEVRRFHGPLTSLRLRDKFPQHGIEAGETLKIVRLICAHHQGWTSCDDKQPAMAVPRRLGVIGQDGLGLGLLADGCIGSFDEEARTLLGEGADPEQTQKLRRMLALFRIADASDIGRHRVPHALSRGAAHDDILDAYLEPGRALIPAPKQALVALVKPRYLQLSARMQELTINGVPPDDDVFERLALEFGAEFTAAEKSKRPGDRFGVDAWGYATHLVRQAAYFYNHGGVHGVYPALVDGTTERWKVQLHLFTDAHRASGARTTVERDVLSEFGCPPGKAQNEAKRGIGDAFVALGIERDAVDLCVHDGVIA